MSTLDSESLRRTALPETDRDRERRRIAPLSVPFLAPATFPAFVPSAQMPRLTTSPSSFASQRFPLAAYREPFPSMRP